MILLELYVTLKIISKNGLFINGRLNEYFEKSLFTLQKIRKK